MNWTLQVVASLPVASPQILIPWTFTAAEIVLFINPTIAIGSDKIHAGWIKQQVVFPSFPEPVAVKFFRVPLKYSYHRLDNTYPYELNFKCFTYLGNLEIIAYEYI